MHTETEFVTCYCYRERMYSIVWNSQDKKGLLGIESRAIEYPCVRGGHTFQYGYLVMLYLNYLIILDATI